MATPISVNPAVRPADCPAAKCANEGCGLLTLSASQLGAIAALFLGAGFYLWQIVHAQNSASPQATVAAAGAQSRDEFIFTELFWLILFITALYYAVAEWILEEQDYRQLRTLSKPLAYFEFYLRVGLAGMFGIAAAGAPEPLRGSLSSIHSSFILLALIYVGFLFWDTVIALAGQVDLAWRVVWWDFLGGCLVLAGLWKHQTAANFGPIIVVLGLLPPFGLLIALLIRTKLYTRFGNRNALR